MTETKAGIATTPSRLQDHLNLWLMVAFGVLLCSVTFRNYRIIQEYGFMRTDCMVSAVVAGFGIAWAFGGAMHYADELLAINAARRPHWVVRILLVLQKRLMMVLQIAAAVLVLGALAAVLFDVQIPGPDYSMLSRGGYIPPQLPAPIVQ